MATTRAISLDEVKKHKRKNNVWIVVHNDVLDVTSFLEEHPGGSEVIMEWAGQDATQAFEDVGHSHDARELMAQFKIGWLPPGERTRFIDTCCPGLVNVSSTKKLDKPWRTFDGSPSSRSVASKASARERREPRVEQRIQSIVVPRQRRRSCSSPPSSSSSSNWWKWALLALAGAIVVGAAYKKYAT